MANLKSEKKLWMNALRQTKEYRLSDQGDVYPEDREDKRNAYHKQHIERDYVEEAKIEIVDKITKHLNDVIFEMICEEMSNRYVFQEQNYLTDAGFEMFEEQFFDFYHEHHGEILHKVMKNIAND